MYEACHAPLPPLHLPLPPTYPAPFRAAHPRLRVLVYAATDVRTATYLPPPLLTTVFHLPARLPCYRFSPFTDAAVTLRIVYTARVPPPSTRLHTTTPPPPYHTHTHPARTAQASAICTRFVVCAACAVCAFSASSLFHPPYPTVAVPATYILPFNTRVCTNALRSAVRTLARLVCLPSQWWNSRRATFVC